jgi:hypothetical protein
MSSTNCRPKSMLFNSDASVLKNNKVHLRLHHIRHRQSVFTAVLIQEMNNNPEFVMKFLKQDNLTPAY